MWTFWNLHRFNWNVMFISITNISLIVHCKSSYGSNWNSRGSLRNNIWTRSGCVLSLSLLYSPSETSIHCQGLFDVDRSAYGMRYLHTIKSAPSVCDRRPRNNRWKVFLSGDNVGICVSRIFLFVVESSENSLAERYLYIYPFI